MDILDDDDIQTDDSDLDFDVNVSALKPNGNRRAPLAKDEEDDEELDEEDEESFDDIKARELAELEEGDDYLFNMDELEQ